MVGETLGGYRLVKEIGRGGMGTVFLAEHTRIDRTAAVKVLLPEFSANPEMVQRFFAEARAASTIKHPGIIEILDCNVDPRGIAFIVSEYLQGRTLAALRSLAGDTASLTAIGIQIAAAMAAAHERGIVHRDLKPDNVFLAESPTQGGAPMVKILDFGIAKLLAPGGSPARTQAGMVMGTPLYMSPEQCRGQADLDTGSDVYSLGCILFQLSCGRPPFEMGSAAELMAAHLTRPAPLPSSVDPRVPPELDALVAEMLAKDPAARPAGMAAVEERLREIGAARAARTVPLEAVAAVARAAETRHGDGTVPYVPAQREAEQTALAEREVGQPAQPGRRRLVLAIGGAAAVVLAGGLAYLLLSPGPRPPEVKRVEPGSPKVEPLATARPEPRPPAGMISMRGGAFLMGSSSDEIAATLRWCKERGVACRRELLEREQPSRQVRLGGFFLDSTEVTNAEFAAWLERQPFRVERNRFVRDERGQLILDLHPAHGGIVRASSGFAVRPEEARKPVLQVTWLGADRYCRDRGGRLPTEAEWEFAARGSGRRSFPWGEQDPRCGEVVFGRSAGAGCPAGSGPGEVGSASADVTPEGARDLGGNVAEWVADVYAAPYPPCGPDCVDPVVGGGAGAAAVRVIRGGDWAQSADACRAAGRSRREQDRAQVNVGFRCALVPPRVAGP